MASIQFRDDVRRAGVYGMWSAVLLPDGINCSALRLPVSESQDELIERVVEATQTVRDAAVPGVAPSADLIVGGGEVWLLVAMPPAVSLDDLLQMHTFNATEIAVIATDIGKTLQALHNAGLAHGALTPRSIVLARSGAAVLTEVGLAGVLGDPSIYGDPVTRDDDDPSGAAAAAADEDAADGTAPEPVSVADLARADIEAWSEIVTGLANLLRATDARSADPDVLDRCARRARTVGLASGLHALTTVARRFAGFPSRASLSDVVRTRTGVEPTLTSLMGSIDALFATDIDDSPDTGEFPDLVQIGATLPDADPGGMSDDDTVPRPGANRPDTSGPGYSGPDRSGQGYSGPGTSGAGLPSAGRPSAGKPTKTIGQPRPSAPAMRPLPSPRVPEPATAQAQVPAMAALTTEAYPGLGTYPRPEATETTESLAPADPWVAPTRADDSHASNGALVLADRLPKATPPTWTIPSEPNSGDPVVRLGRGVPVSQAVRPTRLGRRRAPQRVLLNVGLTFAIIVALLGLRWWVTHEAVRVTSVAVRVEEHVSTGCALDADIIGTITTSGGSGVVTYRWRRNDGTTTALQTVRTGGGSPAVVHLRWSFTGYGQQTAGVALVVVKPQEKQAETSFLYRCVASG